MFQVTYRGGTWFNVIVTVACRYTYTESGQQPFKPTQKPSPSSGTSGNADEKASFFTWDDESEPPSNLFDLFTTDTPIHSPSTPTAASKTAVPRCRNSKLYRHVSLKGGLRSGNFTRLAQHADMADCAEKCCAKAGCDVAILMRTSCFGLRCASVKLCGTRPARLRNFSLKIMYIHRENPEGESTELAYTRSPFLRIIQSYFSYVLFKKNAKISLILIVSHSVLHQELTNPSYGKKARRS